MHRQAKKRDTGRLNENTPQFHIDIEPDTQFDNILNHEINEK